MRTDPNVAECFSPCLAAADVEPSAWCCMNYATLNRSKLFFFLESLPPAVHKEFSRPSNIKEHAKWRQQSFDYFCNKRACSKLIRSLCSRSEVYAMIHSSRPRLLSWDQSLWNDIRKHSNVVLLDCGTRECCSAATVAADDSAPRSDTFCTDSAG